MILSFAATVATLLRSRPVTARRGLPVIDSNQHHPMKNKRKSMLIGAIAICATLSQSNAATIASIALFDAQSNIDGVISPASGSLDSQGLGTINLSVTGVGSHFLGLFVDHEIDEAINTFFNEFGTTGGSAAAGQSWEIDEPGYSSGPILGDIFANFSASGLDDANGVPSATPDDVSMALGWDVTLAAGETALASFTLSTARPTGGFFLSHSDPDSQTTIYFTSTKTIRGGGPNVPDGGWTLAMLGASMTLIGAAKRLRSSHQNLPPA